MNNQVVLDQNKFCVLSEDQQMDISGGSIGGVIAACAVCVVAGVVIDEVVEQTTGKDIASHTADAIDGFADMCKGAAEAIRN